LGTFEAYAEAAGFSMLSWEDDDLALDAVTTFYLRNVELLEFGTRYGLPMILDVHLIDRAGFNAFAGSFEDADVIAIFRDVPMLLLKVARAMVSQGLILPHIRTNGIDVEPVIVPGRYKDLLASVRVWEVHALADPRREEIAKKLSELATLFVLEHEFSHIYSGHADYLTKHLGLAMVAEIEGESLPSPATFERETLEWDADSSASERVLDWAIEPVRTNVNGRTAWFVPLQNRIGSRDDAIRLATIAQAICGYFTVAGEKASILDKAPRTHPHPEFRLSNMFAAVEHSLSYRTGQPPNVYQRIIRSAAEQFFQTINVVFLVKEERDRPDFQTFKAAADARLQIWTSNWEKMHSELDRLKRGGVLAPAVPTVHPAYPTNLTIG
jgi:hypothetical protein